MIYAVYLLKELEVPLRGQIGLCLVADEETGGRGGSAYLEQLGLLGQDGVAMLTPEPTSGVIWNANRGAITLQVTVKGRAAHVGLQHQGVNAFERMIQVAAALQGLKAEVEQHKTGYHIVPAAAAHSILMLGGALKVERTSTSCPTRARSPSKGGSTPKRILRPRRHACLRCSSRSRNREFHSKSTCCKKDRPPVSRPIIRSPWPWRRQSRPSPANVRPFKCARACSRRGGMPEKGFRPSPHGPGFLEVAHGPNEVVEIERIYQNTIIYAMMAVAPARLVWKGCSRDRSLWRRLVRNGSLRRENLAEIQSVESLYKT